MHGLSVMAGIYKVVDVNVWIFDVQKSKFFVVISVVGATDCGL